MGYHRDTDFWEKAYEKWQHSGLSKAQFCKKHRIAISTFSYKIREIHEDVAATPVEFVQVQSTTVTQAFSDRGSGIRLAVGDVRIVVDRDFCPETLKAVLEVLHV